MTTQDTSPELSTLSHALPPPPYPVKVSLSSLPAELKRKIAEAYAAADPLDEGLNMGRNEEQAAAEERRRIATLAALSAVDSAFHQICIPLLWKTVDLTTTSLGTLFFLVFVVDPDRWRLTSSLKMQSAAPDCVVASSTPEGETQEETERTVRSLLRQLPGGKDAFDASVISEVLLSAILAKCSSLVHVEVGPRPRQIDAESKSAILDALIASAPSSTVQSLCLDVHALSLRVEEQHEALLRAYPALSRLDLVCPGGLPRTFAHYLKGLHHLTSLRLFDIDYHFLPLFRLSSPVRFLTVGLVRPTSCSTLLRLVTSVAASVECVTEQPNSSAPEEDDEDERFMPQDQPIPLPRLRHLFLLDADSPLLRYDVFDLSQIEHVHLDSWHGSLDALIQLVALSSTLKHIDCPTDELFFHKREEEIRAYILGEEERTPEELIDQVAFLGRFCSQKEVAVQLPEVTVTRH